MNSSNIAMGPTIAIYPFHISQLRFFRWGHHFWDLLGNPKEKTATSERWGWPSLFEPSLKSGSS